MSKEYEKAFNNMLKRNAETCAGECNVFKVLKDYAYGDPSKVTQFRYSEDAQEQERAENEHSAEHLPEIPNTDADDEPVLAKPYEQDKFRDGLRRIDLVLVADDAQPLAPRTDFLHSVLKAGLHIETEIGIVLAKPYDQDKFRDGLRRIDLVLVAVDAQPLAPRTDFLHSVLKAGLHVETEPGILPMHKNLVFIKIHAPDTILDEYNHGFGSKKYFRDNHLRFVRPELSTVGRLLPCTRISHERELISLVRAQYNEKLRLSNEERSLIVYRILLELPFGERANHYGLKRLLDRKVFLDAYVLHDGPHFMLQNQNWKTINARQILFYNWVGKKNAYKVHPLNLIREYFGERIGMYFAFFEFYNHALIIAALFGLIFFLAAMNNTTDKVFVDDICKDKNKTYICPRCKVFEACRFIKLTDLCYLAKIHHVLDSPFTVYYAACLVIWASTFYALWKRKESYWIWLWEISTDQSTEVFRSQKTGLIQKSNTVIETYSRKIVVTVICILLYAATVPLLVPLFWYKQAVDKRLMLQKIFSLDKEEIGFIVTFAIQLVLFVQILGELVFRIPIHFITKLENHRTYESYTRSFSFKTFAASFMLTFPIMFYYAWLKGLEYFMPVRVLSLRKKYIWTKTRSYYSLTNCAPFTCLDEVFFVLFATIFIRHIAIPFVIYIKGLFYNTLTDFNQGKQVTIDIPAWEREYRLTPVTEQMFTRKRNFLAMQFALVTLVGTVFPLAPLLVLIGNICHIRYEARMFTQCRRRPLLLPAAGFGVWTPILKYLAFICIPTNALTLSRTTKTATRYIYTKRVGSMKGFLAYSTFLASTKIYEFITEIEEYYKDYKEKQNFVPAQCRFPGYFTALKSPPKYFYMAPHNLTYNNEFQEISSGAPILYILFSVFGFVYATAINAAISQHTKELNKIMEIEDKMKIAFRRMSKK